MKFNHDDLVVPICDGGIFRIVGTVSSPSRYEHIVRRVLTDFTQWSDIGGYYTDDELRQLTEEELAMCVLADAR